MSNLTGHARLTALAVRELANTCNSHPLAASMANAGLPGNVVMRDLLDIILLGHWADYGQSHHFMRRFDGQSPYMAYEEDVEWVRSNAQRAARTLSRRIRYYAWPRPVAGVAPRAATQNRCNLTTLPHTSLSPHQARKILGGDAANDDYINWQHLGNAIHALQDSFAAGHARRSPSTDPKQPGAIEYIKVYAGADKHKHADHDKRWFDEKNERFSVTGRHAVNATRALLEIVLTTAHGGTRNNASVLQLHGWNSFQQHWLAASPSLSRARDFAIDLIERFHTGIHLGNNTSTFNMDEEGLAKALLQECGTDMQKVFSVFSRLDGHYDTDVDDVAERYVKRVKDKPGPVSKALSGHKKLVALLIKVMDEGWTSDGEQACIGYLKALE